MHTIRTWRRSLILLPLAMAFAVTDLLSAGPVRGHQKENISLDGTWIAESMVRDGQAIPPAGIAEIRFQFRENALTTQGLLGPGAKTVSSFTTDNTKQPRHVDFKLSGDNPVHGVYELSGDTLRICFPRKGGDRPAALESAKGTATILLTFKRERK